MGRYFIGIDAGTQGSKGLLLQSGGAIVARAHRTYGLIEGLGPGAAEQHPETWFEALVAIVCELKTRARVAPEDVAGIGISGQQHGLVVLDENDEVVRPAKLWCDTSTADEAAELSRRFGRAVPTGFTASKILWLSRHEPENWERTRSVLLPHDYLNFRLCGAKTMECGDASGTGLFDPVRRGFREDEIAAIDPRLSAALPGLIAADAFAGTLQAKSAALLGLREGTPVSAGGGDNMMSAIGSGATRSGVLVASLGTSGTAFSYSATPVVDPEGLIAAFCDSTGGWLPLLCVMNMTGAVEEIRSLIGGHDHGKLSEWARTVPAGSNGLRLLPWLAGERVPDLPKARASLLGMRHGNLDAAHLYRATLEGTSINFALGVDRLRALGIAVDEVRAVGGGAQNRLWLEILSAVLRCPVKRLTEGESAALGAAIQAEWAVRTHAGDELRISDLAESYIATGETIHATASAVKDYEVLAAEFRGLVAAEIARG